MAAPIRPNYPAKNQNDIDIELHIKIGNLLKMSNGMSSPKGTSNAVETAVKSLKGAYLDGEKITLAKPYSTLWADVGIFHAKGYESAESVFWNFMYHDICEDMASRKPLLYYNTWGMQRDEEIEGKNVEDALTEEKILEEIDYAHQIGIDVFVIKRFIDLKISKIVKALIVYRRNAYLAINKQKDI